MKMLKRLLTVIVVVAMAFTVIGCSAGGNDSTSTNSEYVIGFSGPLTGDAAVYGTAVNNSAQMAVDEINANGGLNGIRFKLIATDDAHDATRVATNYASMMEDGMQVSLGTVTTAPGLEFSNLSREDNVFFLTPSASADEIPQYENGFQMCFADGNQGKVAAEYVNTTGYDTIGIFYKSDDPYSVGIYEQFKENLSSDIETVEALFNDTNSSDFSTQISTLQDCSFIFMPIYYTPASVFMMQAKDILAPDTIYYGCDGFDGLAGQMDLTSIPQEVTMLSHFDSNATSGPAYEYIQKYTEKYGSDTLNMFGASAYDCVYAIYGAMEKAISEGIEIPVDISASDLCEILKDQFYGDYVFSGITGDKITWDENGFVNKAAVKYVLKEAD